MKYKVGDMVSIKTVKEEGGSNELHLVNNPEPILHQLTIEDLIGKSGLVVKMSRSMRYPVSVRFTMQFEVDFWEDELETSKIVKVFHHD
jgi:hypothetical protein